MEPGKFSWTAIAAAYLREYHFTHDSPKVFEDTLASNLITPTERKFIEDLCINALTVLDPQLALLDHEAAFDRFFHSFQAVPEVIGRARYNEDKLQEAIQKGIGQYVIIGAGLDTFALRRPDLASRITVFELDHPSTQAFKRERMQHAGLDHPEHLVLVELDFEKEDVAAVLSRSSFDSDRPAFFSWLGVTQYLTRQAVDETLAAIRRSASSGSELVFSYYELSAFDPARQSPAMRQHFAIVSELAEPFLTGLDPSTLSTHMRRLGFELVEDLGQAEQSRYFQDRADDLWPVEFARVALARVK